MDTVVKARPAPGLVALVVIKLALVGVLGWGWVQGNSSSGTRTVTVLLVLFLLLNVRALLRPPELGLKEGRLFLRAGFLQLSTARENVAQVDMPAARLLLGFKDLSKVEAGATLRKILEGNRSQGRPDFSLSMRADPAELERFREAVFQRSG